MTEQDVDIVDRLRDTSHGVRLFREAAAEIERQRGELADGSFYKESDIDALQDRAENAESEARTAYARGIEDAAGAVAALRCRDVPKRDAQDTGEAFDFAIDEAQAAIRALAPDPSRSPDDDNSA